MSGKRADIKVTDSHVVKKYHDPALARHEIGWYGMVGGRFAPRLIFSDVVDGLLLIERGRAVYRPMVSELVSMLKSMELLGIHHRDVHPGNLVTIDGHLRLIDWETAICDAGAPSYDLYGPDVSGLPVPDIHAAIRSKRSPNGYRMWFGCDHPASIRSMWGADVPRFVERRQGSG